MLDVFEPTRLKSGAKITGAVAAVALLLFLSRAHVVVSALASIVFAVTAFQFLMYSSTLAVMNLSAANKKTFQILIAVGVPLLLASCLYYQADTIDLSFIAKKFTSAWMLLPITILFAIGRGAEGVLDRNYPFRGYLIAAAILFVLCLMWSQGLSFDSDDGGEHSYSYFDREEAEKARTTGIYVAQYLLYVAVVYAGICSKQIWSRSH